MTYPQQLCNQSCVCLPGTLSAYISLAPEQGSGGGKWGRMGDRRADAGTRWAFSPCEKLSRHNKKLLKHEIALLTFLWAESSKSQSAVLQVVKRERERRKEKQSELIEIERM